MRNVIEQPVPSLARRVVGDVMIRAVVSAHEAALFKEIAAALARNGISTVPVLDEQRRVVGVVTAADLLARMTHEHGVAPRGHRLASARDTRRKVHGRDAADLMTSPAITVHEATAIREAAHQAAHARVRCLPVVDDDGVLVGIVSKSDLLKVYLRDDDAIQADIERRVLSHQMLLDPGVIDVEVDEGIVSLKGTLERRLMVDQLVASVREVPGVVDLDCAVGYRIDDLVRSNVWPPP